eukprot:TRINITY_DN42825_c0_g1_i1.p1 TRINITY_DN42825_c0_g1~~TRINITY_DN42825_c0_g1_i1.p1  ORF type:complete len:247 (+),score=50.70 TRINITY_DN42825_c0_g1_i1:94-741(+)
MAPLTSAVLAMHQDRRRAVMLKTPPNEMVRRWLQDTADHGGVELTPPIAEVPSTPNCTDLEYELHRGLSHAGDFEPVRAQGTPRSQSVPPRRDRSTGGAPPPKQRCVIRAVPPRQLPGTPRAAAASAAALLAARRAPAAPRYAPTPRVEPRGPTPPRVRTPARSGITPPRTRAPLPGAAPRLSRTDSRRRGPPVAPPRAAAVPLAPPLRAAAAAP